MTKAHATFHRLCERVRLRVRLALPPLECLHVSSEVPARNSPRACGGHRDLGRRDVREFAPQVDPLTRRELNSCCRAFSSPSASGLKTRACTSNRSGTEAPPSSGTRFRGSSRRVMPIFTMRSPKAPRFEMR